MALLFLPTILPDAQFENPFIHNVLSSLFFVYVQGSLCASGRPGPSDSGVFWERADERSPQHTGEYIQVGWNHSQDQVFELEAKSKIWIAIYVMKQTEPRSCTWML